MDKTRGFAARSGLVFGMAAFGMGGFWRVPDLAGGSGGTFLLLYLIMMLLAGAPGLLLELTLGRSARLAPVSGMQRLERTRPTPWSAIGVLGILAGFLIAGAGACVSSGALVCLVRTASGSLADSDPEAMAAAFGGPLTLAFALAAAALLWLCLHAGVRKGVERLGRILVPTLLVLLLGLTVCVCTQPGMAARLGACLLPQLSAVNADTAAAAAAEALRTLGVGACWAFAVGGCAHPGGSLPRSVLQITALQAAAAVLGTVLCGPVLGAAGIGSAAGPAVLLTLARQLTAMGVLGRVVGALLLLCAALASFLTALCAAEALVASLTDAGCSRRWACIAVTAALLPFGLLVSSALGGGGAGRFHVLGMGLFDFCGFLAAVLMCLGALGMALYITVRWGFRKFRREANEGAAARLRVQPWMMPYFCGVFPLLMLALLILLIGGCF